MFRTKLLLFAKVAIKPNKNLHAYHDLTYTLSVRDQLSIYAMSTSYDSNLKVAQVFHEQYQINKGFYTAFLRIRMLLLKAALTR